MISRISYREYLQTAEWKWRRAWILTKARGRCQVCKRNQAQHVHHTTYVRVGRERTTDLQAICLPCHNAQHPDKPEMPASRLQNTRCKFCENEGMEVFRGDGIAYGICITCGETCKFKCARIYTRISLKGKYRFFDDPRKRKRKKYRKTAEADARRALQFATKKEKRRRSRSASR